MGNEVAGDDVDTVALTSPVGPSALDADPTLLDPPRSKAAGAGQTSQTSAVDSGSYGSPLAALRLDEMARTRALATVGIVISAVVLAVIPFFGGDAVARRVFHVMVACALVANTWLRYLAGSSERYTAVSVAIAWHVVMAAVGAAVVYFGVFSPVAVIVMMGVYFVALGHSMRLALSVYVFSAGSHALIGVLVSTGTIRDAGLVHAGYLAMSSKLLLLLLVHIILINAFVLARWSRRATLATMTRFDEAVRAISQREALLIEARQELDHALRLNGPGRFSGQTIGSFELGDLIGRGAMGEVYAANHSETGAEAAVKLLHLASLRKANLVQRFLREVRIASALQVPQVVKVIEIGDENAELPYLAMERLHGDDLGHLLRARRRFSAEQVIELVDQVAKGLAAASAAGIIHRDIKPQNLFRTTLEDGRVQWKILDFGVSKLARSRVNLTLGHVVGTPMYMAPEQAQAKKVTPAADRYALGCVAYRALTAHPPFRGRDVASLLYDVVHNMPSRPSAWVDLPDDIDAFFAIALAKKAADRFEDPQELSAGLAAAVRGELSAELRRRGEQLSATAPWRGE